LIAKYEELLRIKVEKKERLVEEKAKLDEEIKRIQIEIEETIPIYKGTEIVLGAGSDGIVISDTLLKSQNMVRKFSKNLDDMDNERFPLEFCIAHITKSPYIVTVEEFNPYDVTAYAGDINKPIHKIIKPSLVEGRKYVPSFKSEECAEINWTQLAIEFEGQEHKVLENMIYAVHHVHESLKVSILDIKDDNIMHCKDGFKFIDMSHARLFNDENLKTISHMKFGAYFFRSPWARIFAGKFAAGRVDLEVTKKLYPWLRDVFYFEYEAEDFWSIGFTFMKNFCGIHGGTLDKLFTDFIQYLPKPLTAKESVNNNWEKIFHLQFFDLFSQGPCVDNEGVQNLLKKVFQVNPQKRLEEIRRMFN